jgi:hypothetical protein
MIAFRVSINGNVVTTAGIPGPHVLTAIISSAAGPTHERISVDVGGLASRQGSRRQRHLDWLGEELKLGDQVLVEIVKLDSADEPIANQAVKSLPVPKRRAGGPRLRVAR